MLLADDSEKYFMVSMFAVCVAAVFIVRLVLLHRQRLRISELQAQAADNEARLKGLMLQRGMNAAEIERLLSAGNNSKLDIAAGAQGTPESRMVEILASNGYGGKDIERVLKAAREVGIDSGAVKTVETLASNWAKSEDIERIVKARKKDE